MRLKLIFLILLIPSVLFAAAPVIFYTDITSGPDSGWGDDTGANKDQYGCYLSIFGRNFGANIDNISVTVGGGAVARNMYLGTSYGRPDVQWLAVQLGPACATGNIVVTVSGETPATGPDTFTVRAGDVRYLSKDGNNSTGAVNDITKPYRDSTYLRTLMAALPDDGAGDFVCVLGGTWNLGTETKYSGSWWYIGIITGTQENPLTIYGYPGNTPTVEIPADGDNAFETSGSYNPVGVVFANIQVDILLCEHSSIVGMGASDSCAICSGESTTGEATYMRVVNVVEDGNSTYGWCGLHGQYGFAMGYSSHCKLLGVTSKNGGIDDLNEPHGHVFYILGKQHDNEVGYCYITNIHDSRAVFQMHMDNHPTVEHPYCCHDGTKQITDIYVHDNIITDVGQQAFLTDGAVGDVYYWNNVIIDASDNVDANQVPVDFRGGTDTGVTNIVFYNNSIYTNSATSTAAGVIGFGFTGSQPVQSAVLKNNIIYATDPNDSYTSLSGVAQTAAGYTGITGDHNCWYGLTGKNPTFDSTGQVTSDPKYTTNGSDLSLQATSPCIDTGTALGASYDMDYLGGSRPYNSIWDMGAYEYGASPAGISGLQFYLSNPSGSGLAQSNPNASLGGYRSTTQITLPAMKNLFDNITVAESVIGDTEYRMIDVYNAGTTDATKVQIFMKTPTSSPSTEIAFGASMTDQPHADNWNGEALANESTAPASPVFTFANRTRGSPLSLGTIPAGQSVRIGVKRTVSPLAIWTSNDLGVIGIRWLGGN